MRSFLRAAGLAAGVAALTAPAARAQVQVDSGETLTEADLLAGLFGGQSFTLAPGTIFDINGGAVIGPVGSQSGGLTPFDFLGSTVNINSGGRFESLTFPGGSVVTNLVLNVFNGGAVGDFFYALDGNTVHIDGGSTGHSFFARQSVVQLTGGVIGDGFTARDSDVQISGGAIGDGAEIDGSTIFSSTGGRVGDDFMVWGGSTANIEGGRFGAGFRSGGVVNLSGGSFGQDFQSAGALTLSGAEFTLDGAAVSDLTGGLPAGGVLTGTLADGSVFIFSNLADEFRQLTSDQLASGATTLNTVALAPADTTPILVNSGEGPSTGLRAGQTLTLAGTATLRDHFAAVGATLNIDGGAVGFGLETARSQINITGGVVGDTFTALDESGISISAGAIGDNLIVADSSLQMTGGAIGDGFSALRATVELHHGAVGGGANATDSDILVAGATVHGGLRATRSSIAISGGSMGDYFEVYDGTIAITGGAIGQFFQAVNCIVDISGGSIGDAAFFSGATTVNLFVTTAAIDGVTLDLALGETTEITTRGGALLEATLLDGSALDFTLSTVFVTGQDFFHPSATLTITYIPAPGAAPLLALAGVLAGRRRR